MGGCMYGYMDWWIYVLVDGWVDGWMGGWLPDGLIPIYIDAFGACICVGPASLRCIGPASLR